MSMRFAALIAILWLALLPITSAFARDGDTLRPIKINASTLVTYPATLLTDNDFKAIDGRVNEARNSGVPLAVRIIDLSQAKGDIPSPVRHLASVDLSQPLPQSQIDQITQNWINTEPVETAPDGDDGFLLLVVVPADRTQTQALWRIGPNALPLNGLTAANIAATVETMNQEFAQGNMPNGVFRGLQEFGSNIQFGVPERLQRTTMQTALSRAMIPLAIITMLAGISIPIIAWTLGRRSHLENPVNASLSPWEAAAIHEGRVLPAITAAMLLDAVHTGVAEPLSDGGLRISASSTNPAVEALRPFASGDGIVPRAAMLEVEGITHDTRIEIEDCLAEIGAFTDRARTDRTWILLAMAITAFLIALGLVPIVVSMSTIGIYGIGIGLVGIAAGWWWLSARSYSTEAGTTALNAWLDAATPEERNCFDLVVHQTHLIERSGGPNASAQMRLVRHFRGLGAH